MKIEVTLSVDGTEHGPGGLHAQVADRAGTGDEHAAADADSSFPARPDPDREGLEQRPRIVGQLIGKRECVVLVNRDVTRDHAADFFSLNGALTAIGIGSFGPIDLRRTSPTWGRITTTPKPGWADTEVVAALRAALGLPVAFDTDVNAAALGEHRWGAAVGLETFCYITVGTGIGGGGMANGHLLHGLLHPELGHMRIPHDRARDPFDGICPYHGDCFEGLASGAAVSTRWGSPPEQITDERAWQLEAEYLALGLVNLICVLSPQRIIVWRRRHERAVVATPRSQPCASAGLRVLRRARARRGNRALHRPTRARRPRRRARSDRARTARHCERRRSLTKSPTRAGILP